MRVSFVTMPYKDREKRREFERRWRDKNREKLNAQRRKRWREKKRVRELRVVLTPLTRAECQVSFERLQRRKAVARDAECRRCAERARERKEAAKRRKLERNREWKKANREKVREQKKRWWEKNRERVNEQKRQWRQVDRERKSEQQRKRRQADPEKSREQQRTWYQNNREWVIERKQRWRKDNPEKLRAQKERRRGRLKVQLRTDEARRQVVREKGRVQKLKWRHANVEKVRAQQREWRQANREKIKAQRGRRREADRVRSRQYYATHKEQCSQRRKERYYKQRGRPVPSPPPQPCDCGVCLACGGWGVSWKPTWYARLDAFCAPKDQSTPAVTLEELPLDLLESEAEAETLSLASTSEIDSELGDRLDALLADESDSEMETGDKVETPTRRSNRIATMPSVSYKDWTEEENLMSEFLRRKTQLHAEGVDRIVTRWELLEHRTERVDAIVEEMSLGVDPTHQLDRFHNQLERQDCVMSVMVSEDLLDFVDAQLL